MILRGPARAADRSGRQSRIEVRAATRDQLDRQGPAPLPAHLTSAVVLASGAVYVCGGDVALHADAALALVIGPHETIVGYAAALELVEVGRDLEALRAVAAADLSRRAVIFGPPKPRLSAVDGRLVINDHVRAGAFLEGGYVELVKQLSSALSDTGESLLPGDRVIAGPIVRAPVRPGDRVVADLGPLGHAAIVIA